MIDRDMLHNSQNSTVLKFYFMGGNGFPTATYHRFLTTLETNYSIIAPEPRPLWSNDDPWRTHEDWSIFTDDMIANIEKDNLQTVIGCGHSLGAIVTLMAAVKRPDLFSQIILIEPPLRSPQTYMSWEAMRTHGEVDMREVPMVKQALTRVAQFDSREIAFERYRAKRFFSLWPDETIWDYVNYGMIENEDGITLAFPAVWEGWIFSSIPLNLWEQIEQLRTPTVIVRAEHTDVLPADVWSLWKAKSPTAQFVQMPDVSHMLPFEKPQQVAELIMSHIKS